MVVIEMRDAAYDTAFDLLEEAKHNAKKTKLTLCELEDAMYDCYEASKDEQEDYEEEPEMEFRNRRSYRHDGEREDDEEMDMRYGRMNRRTASRMRMRRNRMGRFA